MLITRLLMAAVLTSAMFGQSNVGEISGQVSDSTGAAIPGCVITATHTQTGLKRTIETDNHAATSAANGLRRKPSFLHCYRKRSSSSNCSMASEHRRWRNVQ